MMCRAGKRPDAHEPLAKKGDHEVLPNRLRDRRRDQGIDGQSEGEHIDESFLVSIPRSRVRNASNGLKRSLGVLYRATATRQLTRNGLDVRWDVAPILLIVGDFSLRW